MIDRIKKKLTSVLMRRTDPHLTRARAFEEAASRDVADPWWDLHHAAYHGRVDVVRRLLAAGADPNQPHPESHTGWICGPTPLSKAICAWAVTSAHVEIAELLLLAGARVGQEHYDDANADSVGSHNDARIMVLLRQYERKGE